MSFTGAVKKLRMSRKSVWDIDAESVGERIQERRDRIKRRMETAKRMQKLLSLKKSLGMLRDGEENELRDFVEAAASKGARHIYQIDTAGEENVSNIQVSAANDFCSHKTANRKKREQLKKELEEEEAAMKVKFEEILGKWSFDHKTGPTNLFEDILAQKELCGELLGSKNNIICLLEDEQRAADESYKELIGKYNKNINIVSCRMEAHQEAMEKTLSLATKNLEKGFDKQKSHMLKQSEQSFNKSIEAVGQKCSEDLESRLNLVKEQEEEITETIHNDAASQAETRMNMEACVRELEDEISMIKALTFVNNERLDYEIHVLTKHEEENSLIISDQKRRITSLQDQANKMKMKVMEADKGAEKEKDNLIENIRNMKQQIKDLDIKQKKFGAQSAKRRTEMATMMKTEAFRILEKITQNDEILESFYLSRPFSSSRRESEASQPTLSIMGRIDKQRHSVIASHKTSLFKKRRRSTKVELKSSATSARTGSVESVKKEVDMKKILFTLIDKADFLMEDDLNDMMMLLPNKEKLLVKVASILDNLGVKSASDLERIVEHLTAIGLKEGEQEHFESTAEKRSRVRN